eukprot:COSAG02_NODE_12284_length_1568_cov_23.299523_1_plen_203_part_00
MIGVGRSTSNKSQILIVVLILFPPDQCIPAAANGPYPRAYLRAECTCVCLLIVSFTGWVRIQSAGGTRTSLISILVCETNQCLGRSAECASLISAFYILHKNATQPVTALLDSPPPPPPLALYPRMERCVCAQFAPGPPAPPAAEEKPHSLAWTCWCQTWSFVDILPGFRRFCPGRFVLWDFSAHCPGRRALRVSRPSRPVY